MVLGLWLRVTGFRVLSLPIARDHVRAGIWGSGFEI